MVLNAFAVLDIAMKKVKVAYETIAIGSEKVRFKFWPAKNCSDPDKVPHYVGVLTRVKPEMIDRVEKAISRNHQIKGIFYQRI